MKKILFLLLLMIPMVGNAREYELYCSVKNQNTGGPFFEDESVRFEFQYFPWAYWLRVKIINKTDERITVEWENARMQKEQICFRSDNIFSYNNPKSDEVIHAESSTIKEIEYREEPDFRSRPFREKSLKERGECINSIILPIRYSSGEIKDYKVYIYLRYK